MVHVILRHLLYFYFVTRKASPDTLLAMLLETILNDLLLYILFTNLWMFYLLPTSFYMFSYVCIQLCWYIYIYIYIYVNLPVNAIVRLPHLWSGDRQVQKTVLAPSADKQTHNYEKECSNHHPSLSTLRSKELSRTKMKWWAIYINLRVNAIVRHTRDRGTQVCTYNSHIFVDKITFCLYKVH